jgi:hypothetical protein
MESQGWRELAKLAGKNFRAATDLVPFDGATARDQFIAHRVDLIRWVVSIMQELATLRDVLDKQDAAALETTAKRIAEARIKWLSGAYDEETSSVNMDQARMNIGHLLFGSLADRGKKK